MGQSGNGTNGKPEWSGDRDRDRLLMQARLRRVRQGRRHRERSANDQHQRLVPLDSFFSRFVALFLGLAIFSLVGIGGLGVFGYAYFNTSLPSAEVLLNRQLFQSVNIYDRNGVLLASLWDKDKGGRREWVKLEDISPHLINCTLAAEDPRFYENPGVDPASVIRAFYQNYDQGGITSGASTITMQLARNALMDPEERFAQSWLRKIREAILAVQMTNSLPKDTILEMYLNTVYYGNLSYGIKAASNAYFNKEPKELTLSEAALLAGLPQAPSYYDPFTNPEPARQRQIWVLDSTIQHGYLTEGDANAAKDQQIVLVRKEYDFLAPHFVNYVSGLLWEAYGPEMYHRGLEVHTTLDYELQRRGEAIVKEHVASIRSLNANDGALVALNPHTGEILTMVGSADYYDDSIDGQVNICIAERQPGSTLKPFTYLTGMLQKGVTPSTVLIDRQILFDANYGNVYAPGNHDGAWHGPVTIRRALASSLNVPAVLMMDYVGLDSVLDTLHRFGITTLNDRERYGLAITLGGGEVKLIDLTYAYSVFANQGLQVGEQVPIERQRLGYADLQPTPFLKIEDSFGEVLYEYTPKERRLISPGEAYMITSIISDNEAQEPTYGPNNELLMPRPAAAKTGTTEWYQDSWTIGYTPDLVAGAWVGNANNDPMKRVVGSSGAGKIWNQFIQEALAGQPPQEFIVPEGVQQAETWASDATTTKWKLIRDWFLIDRLPESAPNGEKSGWFLDIKMGKNEYNMPTVSTELINVPQWFRQGATDYWTNEDAPKEPERGENERPFEPYWAQVVNTGGQGAYLRHTPNLPDVKVLVPEGTKVQVTKDDRLVRKTNWKYVRDEQGQEGWIPDYWIGNISPD